MDNNNHSNPQMPKGISCWWYTYPSEKYESRVGYLGIILPKWMEKNTVPNQQPDNNLFHSETSGDDVRQPNPASNPYKPSWIVEVPKVQVMI